MTSFYAVKRYCGFSFIRGLTRTPASWVLMRKLLKWVQFGCRCPNIAANGIKSMFFHLIQRENGGNKCQGFGFSSEMMFFLFPSSQVSAHRPHCPYKSV